MFCENVNDSSISYVTQGLEAKLMRATKSHQFDKTICCFFITCPNMVFGLVDFGHDNIHLIYTMDH